MNLVSRILFGLYARRLDWSRAFVIRAVRKMEGGELYSQTLRRIFREYHKVEIGLYTHGECFVPGAMDLHTQIGRYCSIAKGVRSMNRNHPMEFKSTHALFFNPALGCVETDRIDYIPLQIGNDVWIGANALIMPNCRRISDGAVIGAGAVVHTDIPPYAVVVGNPGRVVRYRFSQAKIAEILASKWWEKPVNGLDLQEFSKPMELVSHQNATAM